MDEASSLALTKIADDLGNQLSGDAIPRKETIVQFSNYTPHSGQLHLHQMADEYPHLVLEVARRWGKSRFALMELLFRYIQSLSIPVSSARVPPFHAWIVVPTFPQGRQIWDEIVHFLPRQLIYPDGIHHEEQFIHLRGSSVRPWGKIELKSANKPESLQTVGLDFLWVCEAQDIANEAFEKLLPTLMQPESMSRSVYEGIPAMYPDHWFRKNYVYGLNRRNGYYSFKATAYENPNLTEGQLAEIETARELLTEKAWQRMYMAMFSESAGYFTNVNACVEGEELPFPIPGNTYVAGLDLGRKVDVTVLTILDSRERRVVHHKAFDPGEPWAIQKETVIQMCREWEIDRLCVDATGIGGDIFCEELQDANLAVEPFSITSYSRDDILKKLAVSIERTAVRFPPIQALLRQLRAFQVVRKGPMSARAEAPPGEHDDEVFALALGLNVCEPSEIVMGGRSNFSSMRYIPTDEETYSGVSSRIQRRLNERQAMKMRERAQRAGISIGGR